MSVKGGRWKIDRISESTNFNGIQLLDGTLGAREGAFTTARVGAVAGIDVNISTLLPGVNVKAANTGTKDPAAVAASHWHMSVPSKEEVKPGFAIDFADLEITGFAASGTNVTGSNQTIKINMGNLGNIQLKVKTAGTGAFASQNPTVTLANAIASGATKTHTIGYSQIDGDNNGTITGDEVAQALANLVGAIAAGTSNPAGVVRLGGAATGAFYSVQADGDKLVFTYAGDPGNKAAATAKDPVDSTMDALFGNIQVSIGSKAGNQTGHAYHAVTDIKEPVVGDAGKRAGIAMEINDTVVADGMRLVIEDKTFVFRTNADSIVGADAAAGEILIDVSAYATGVDQINAAIKKMSNYETANFTITAHTGAAATGVIWIDQTEESLAANNFYTELSDLTSLISANRGGKAAGLKVTMDASTLQDGDAVRIDGQTYQFVSKAGQADITGAKEIVLASIGDGLTNGELIDALIDNLPAGSYVDIEMLGSALTLVVCERR